jgi:hypothetical protein
VTSRRRIIKCSEKCVETCLELSNDSPAVRASVNFKFGGGRLDVPNVAVV